MNEKVREFARRLSGWKTVLLVAAVGLALLLWPSGTAGGDGDHAAAEETRVEALLGRVEGVGEVHVLLSEDGAAVVCQGADDASVRLAVLEAVRSYTGLLTSEIMVLKMN